MYMTNEELVEKIKLGISINENLTILYKQNYEYIKKLVYPYSKCFGQSTKKATTVFEIDDLMNESYFSICKAVNKYNPDLKIKFMTFAAAFIKFDAKQFIESKRFLIHIPVNKSNLIWRYSVLLNQHPSESDDFFEKELKISLFRLKELKKINQASQTLSMDLQTNDEDSESTMHNEILIDISTEDTVIQEMTEKKVKSIWDEVEKVCTQEEVFVVKEHYINNLSFEKIGRQMGKCAEIARRHKVKALDKLRHDSNVVDIAEWYFDDYTSKCAYHYGVQRFKDTMTSSTEFIAMKHLEKQPNQYKYWLSEEGLSKIKSWVNLGMMKQQIASRMGITRQTLRMWSKEYPEIAEILKGKDTK